MNLIDVTWVSCPDGTNYLIDSVNHDEIGEVLKVWKDRQDSEMLELLKEGKVTFGFIKIRMPEDRYRLINKYPEFNKGHKKCNSVPLQVTQ